MEKLEFTRVGEQMYHEKLENGMNVFVFPKPEHQKRPKATDFQAVKGKYRKPGTGCITKINDHLWEGRYSPKVDGRRIARNVYAPTEKECEQKLAELIAEMKKELEPLRAKKKAG